MSDGIERQIIERSMSVIKEEIETQVDIVWESEKNGNLFKNRDDLKRQIISDIFTYLLVKDW